MGASHHPRSPTGASRTRRHHFLYIFLAIVVVAAYSARSVLYDTYTLLALPLFKWRQHASEFYLSAARDDFDITFANYSLSQTGAGPGYKDKVPAILHHISLGSGSKSHEKWMQVRQDCLDLHPGWEAHLWTDETATRLVEERFPELKEMWEAGYKFPIQRIDALRYMVLYHYGGVILDMDLQCKRGLGPLRRFQFVAPAAVPTGFSIGFMMAEKGNKFVGELVGNLRRYNRGWLGLPYPTVMFSTGCHYASTIHAFMSRQDRKELKILAGTRENPRMHSLNGPVSTPLFNHLGSSSWHSYDAAMIVTIGKSGGLKVPLIFVAVVLLSFVVIRRARRRRLGGGGLVGVSSPRLKVTC